MLVWACEKFSGYILGKRVHLETDHKPLVPLLSKTHLDRLPPRVLRFRLRLMRFDYSVSHVPGKLLYTADALSRAPVDEVITDEDDTEAMVHAIMSLLPASNDRLDEYRRQQDADATCSKLKAFCTRGWPKRNEVIGTLSKFWRARGELTVTDGLLLYGTRIVVPESLRKQTLTKVHQGHQGINRCRSRILSSVWWPGVTTEMEDFIKQCPQCQKSTTPPVEPMMETPLPNHPWERVAADLFELKGTNYIVVVDYFSRYVEVKSLTSTTAANVVAALKSIFSRHGVPTILMTDNGPQFSCKEMAEFAELYGFHHQTSSPHYPQSNGQAERAVRTVKQLLEHSADPYMALLSYRATPLSFCGLSPAELLMGRRIRTDIPQATNLFVPEWSYLDQFNKQHKKYKARQRRNYNRRHRVRSLPSLPDDQLVWVNTRGSLTPGRVIEQASSPRSYVVETPSGRVHHTHHHLHVRFESASKRTTGSDTEETPRVIETCLRTGTQIRPPDRLQL